MRDMFGSFTDEQWLVYKQAFVNLAPGGWIEQVEAGIPYASDDGPLKPDFLLNGWDKHYNGLCAKTGKNIDTMDTFPARLENAGFTNIYEKEYKVPVGARAKSSVLKEAGKFCKAQILERIEGYAMFLLTKFGEPTSWTLEEVQAYLAKVRGELNDPKLHAYCMKRRVWAQKPYDAEAKVGKE